MEAVSCFLRNKGSCPLQPREGRDADKGKQSRCLTAVLYRVFKTGVRLHRVKRYKKQKQKTMDILKHVELLKRPNLQV